MCDSTDSQQFFCSYIIIVALFVSLGAFMEDLMFWKAINVERSIISVSHGSFWFYLCLISVCCEITVYWHINITAWLSSITVLTCLIRFIAQTTYMKSELLHWLQKMNMSCSFWHTEIRCLITENLSFQFIIAKFLNNCLTWVFQWQSKDDKLAGKIFLLHPGILHTWSSDWNIYLLWYYSTVSWLVISIIHLLMTEFFSLFTIAIFAKNNEKLHLNFFTFKFETCTYMHAQVMTLSLNITRPFLDQT